jgi:type I restriction enzyme S subunit
LKAKLFRIQPIRRSTQNILKSAFSGQLVPQDPNYEPASLLLERIRAELAARGVSGKRGRNDKRKEP